METIKTKADLVFVTCLIELFGSPESLLHSVVLVQFLWFVQTGGRTTYSPIGVVPNQAIKGYDVLITIKARGINLLLIDFLPRPRLKHLLNTSAGRMSSVTTST